MGKIDIITKDYVQDNRIVADIFNKLIYKGKEKIRPEELHELDTVLLGVPYGTEEARMPVQKFRDILKCLSVRKDDSAVYVLFGIELQSKVHYAMPVRSMVYDALQYAAQVENAARSYQKKKVIKENKHTTAAEYLSGFYRDDKLLPVITLTLHLGTEKWDGPLTLHEMLEVEDSEYLEYIPDYRMNLISPMTLTDEEIGQFHTSLREVLLFIKYSKDKKKLEELLDQNERFRELERSAVRVLNTVTHLNLEWKEDEEVVNVCQAWKEMREDARKEGLKEGQLAFARKMLQKGTYSLEEISELSGLTMEEVEDLIRLSEKK